MNSGPNYSKQCKYKSKIKKKGKKVVWLTLLQTKRNLTSSFLLSCTHVLSALYINPVLLKPGHFQES